MSTGDSYDDSAGITWENPNGSGNTVLDIVMAQDHGVDDYTMVISGFQECTTSIPSTTTTTTTATPPPATPSNEVFFAIAKNAPLGGFDTYQYSAYDGAYEASNSADPSVDMCGKDAYNEPANGDSSFGGAQPQLPNKTIGPFTSHGIDGCLYTPGPDDHTPGTMTCPGVPSITCGLSPGYGDTYFCGVGNDDFDVDPLVACYW